MTADFVDPFEETFHDSQKSDPYLCGCGSCPGFWRFGPKRLPQPSHHDGGALGAGGGTDATARIVGTLLEKELGQPVNVVNRTGGNGVVGHSAIALPHPMATPWA